MWLHKKLIEKIEELEARVDELEQADVDGLSYLVNNLEDDILTLRDEVEDIQRDVLELDSNKS